MSQYYGKGTKLERGPELLEHFHRIDRLTPFTFETFGQSIAQETFRCLPNCIYRLSTVIFGITCV